MAATRNSTTDPEAPASGLTDQDREDIASMIAEAVKGGKAPSATTDDPKGPKPVTDSEWDSWPERRRESWVRELVSSYLDDLAKDDEIRSHREEIDKLKADKKPEPEAQPGITTKLQRFLWGERDK